MRTRFHSFLGLSRWLRPAVLAAAGVTISFASAHAVTITTAQGSGADTYVESTAATTNYGAAGSMKVRGAGTLRGTYLRFDVGSALGADKKITGAALKLYFAVDPALTAPLTVTVYGVNDGATGDGATGWSETGLTYNNAPSNLVGASATTWPATALFTFTVPAGSTPARTALVLDRTRLTAAQYANLVWFLQADRNGSVTFALKDTSGRQQSIELFSAEETDATGNYAPALDVTTETLNASPFSFIHEWQVDPNGTLGACDGLAFSPDGQSLAASDNLATVRLYRLSDYQLLRTFVHRQVTFNGGHNADGEANAVHFSPNGQYLVTGVNDAGAKVWRVSDGTLMAHLDPSTSTDGAAFSPDGAWLASAAANQMVIRSFNQSTGQVGGIAGSIAHGTSGELNSIDWTANAQRVVGGGLKVIKLNERQGSSWNTILTINNSDVPNGSVKSTRLSPDDALIAMGARDERSRVYNLSGAMVANLRHAGNRTPLANDDSDTNVAIEAVEWSADGQYLFTSGLVDGVMRAWRRADWSLVGWAQAQEANRAIEYIGVAADDRVAACGDEGTVSLHRFTASPVLNPFQFSGGVVAVEVEHADSVLAQGNHRWSHVAEAGAVGEGALLAEAVASQWNGAVRDTGYQTYDPKVDSPKLDFRVTFPASGTYYVWVRGYGPDDGNSVHVGLNGNTVTSAEKIQFGSNGSTTWMWDSTNRAGGRATISVGSAGTHTVNLWMREDGVKIDRVVIANTSGYNPGSVNGGNGPDESSRFVAP